MMSRGRSQFVGCAGQYYVAYALSVRHFHAAITMGNAPDIDILVSAVEGSRHLALQVKTARNALVPSKKYGNYREWPVSNQAVGQNRLDLWYAFVDLQEADEAGPWSPLVYIVPSLWVGAYLQPEWKAKRFALSEELQGKCIGQWGRIGSFLAGESDPWATTTPENLEWWRKC